MKRDHRGFPVCELCNLPVPQEYLPGRHEFVNHPSCEDRKAKKRARLEELKRRKRHETA